MIFSDNRNYTKSFYCKFCNANFRVFNKCWFHQEKCYRNIDETKLKKSIAIYEKIEEYKKKEMEREIERENKEINDEYEKINGTVTGIYGGYKLVKTLERIQNLRKKMRKDVIELKYEEKVFDKIRNYIHEN